MSDKKDYLSQLAKEAGDKQLESFQEEKVERVVKQHKPMNKKIIIGGLVGVVLIGILSYFLFFSAKIEMPNFVGKSESDVLAWVKQYGISNQGIVMNEEYNFDVEKDVIISQSIEPNTKVKPDVILTLVKSKGADPTESVEFLANATMATKDEINDWITENKLTKAKITSEYSSTVAENQVIKIDLRGLNEADFKRNSTVVFTVSKGAKPAATVTIDKDYTGVLFNEFETYANSKNLVIERLEVNSNDVETGKIVYLSVKKGDQIKEGSKVTVQVSKGRAVVMKDLTSMSIEEAELWLSNNNVRFSKRVIFHNAHDSGTVLTQSISVGTKLDENSYLQIDVSKGYINLADFHGGIYDPSNNPKSFFELRQWVYKINHDGDAQMPQPIQVDGSTEENQKYPAGTIIRFVDDNIVDNYYYQVGSTIKVVVSTGEGYSAN